MTMTADPWHGTAGGYTNHRCRCESCIEAHRWSMQDDRARRALAPVPSHVHGTNNGYENYACRCEACTTVHKAKLTRWRRARRSEP